MGRSRPGGRPRRRQAAEQPAEKHDQRPEQLALPQGPDTIAKRSKDEGGEQEAENGVEPRIGHAQQTSESAPWFDGCLSPRPVELRDFLLRADAGLFQPALDRFQRHIVDDRWDLNLGVQGGIGRERPRLLTPRG